MTLRGVVISLDGQRFVDHTAAATVGDRADAVALGQAVVCGSVTAGVCGGVSWIVPV